MKHLIITLILILGIQANSFSQNKEYKALIKEYLELNGTEKSFKGVVFKMFELIKPLAPEVPETFWDEAILEFSNIDIDELVDLYAPIYFKYLNQDDMKDIVAFYKTPAGKKLGLVTPNMTTDSMKAGEEWGKELAEKIIAKLKKQGYKL